MSTSNSPIKKLRAQAEMIATIMQRAERGEPIPAAYQQRIIDARAKNEAVKIGIVMDDKLVTITMPWAVIRDTGELGLTEYILKQMRGDNPTVN